MIIVIPLYPVFWALHAIHRGLRSIFPKIWPWHTAIIIAAALFAGLLLLGQAQAADFATVPDPTLTPGAVRTIDPVEICEHGTRGLRHMTRARSDCLPPGPHPDFEIDPLVPLGVGGADGDSNLWPEPRRAVEPIWNAQAKDRLEIRLNAMICAGEISPVEVQAAFTDDWTEAYRKYVSNR